MEESIDRELEAILKLLELTQEGLITWETRPPTGDLFDTNSIKYTNIMHCRYESKNLRIYTERKLRDKPNALTSLLSDSILGVERSYPYWAERTILEICSEQGQSLWRFVHKPAIKDLLNAAKYQASGIKDFLNTILKS